MKVTHGTHCITTAVEMAQSAKGSPTMQSHRIGNTG